MVGVIAQSNNYGVRILHDDDESNKKRGPDENCFARAFGGMVVRVNAGGDAPPDPPSIGDVTGHSPFLCFLQEQFFGELAGKYFWRVDR